MTSIRAVVFDLGHTVWDFDPPVYAWRYTIVRLLERLSDDLGQGIPEPRTLDKALAETVNQYFKKSNESGSYEQPPSEEPVREALTSLGIPAGDRTVRDLTAIAFGSEIGVRTIEPDTLAAFGELERRGIAMGCITNTVTSEEGIRESLRQLGMLRYLRSVVVSSELGHWKPHPLLFQRALAELDVGAPEAVFVGDRLHDDIYGAKSVGMYAVLTHQYRQEQIDRVEPAPYAVVQRLGELPNALEVMEAS